MSADTLLTPGTPPAGGTQSCTSGYNGKCWSDVYTFNLVPREAALLVIVAVTYLFMSEVRGKEKSGTERTASAIDYADEAYHEHRTKGACVLHHTIYPNRNTLPDHTVNWRLT